MLHLLRYRASDHPVDEESGAEVDITDIYDVVGIIKKENGVAA